MLLRPCTASTVLAVLRSAVRSLGRTQLATRDLWPHAVHGQCLLLHASSSGLSMYSPPPQPPLPHPPQQRHARKHAHPALLKAWVGKAAARLASFGPLRQNQTGTRGQVQPSIQAAHSNSSLRMGTWLLGSTIQYWYKVSNASDCPQHSEKCRWLQPARQSDCFYTNNAAG
jgi:hypothetical protein